MMANYSQYIRVEKDLVSILEYLEGERDRRLSSFTEQPVRVELTEEHDLNPLW